MKPIIICLTPVRNEAWCLKAFIETTSLWADYIIIVDQNSTDGSKEIAMNYPKVRLVENPNSTMYQSKTRQLLFKEANKIKGEKIILALDADEILTGNIFKSNGWLQILNSRPGDVFTFRWLNLYNDFHTGKKERSFMEWGGDYGHYIDGNYPDTPIHEIRIPLRVNSNWVNIEDIWFIHFANLLPKRQSNKRVFYQISTLYFNHKKSIISLHRTYYISKKKKIILDMFNNDIYEDYLKAGIEISELIDTNDVGNYFVTESLKMIKEKGFVYFKGLDIWNNVIFQNEKIMDPRSSLLKILHFYLRVTSDIRKLLVVRAFDKILKLCGY